MQLTLIYTLSQGRDEVKQNKDNNFKEILKGNFEDEIMNKLFWKEQF
jgi:hypothetical protein